ncbi:MAG: transcription antitermination factor NusB [Aquificaceae bacterium]|nr:transcription antitermination factor NusB [Aquificaceae bacterium]MDW8236895.1 transcription antitermination factor NusB [Aquificaceae bacterium]
MIHRKRSRRDAFLILYQWEVSGEDLEQVFESFYRCFKAHSERRRYSKMLIRLFKENIESVEKKLAESLIERDPMGIGSIERAILRVAITELGFKKISKVDKAVGDYIKLASRYADSGQVKLVSGVLMGFVRRLSFPEP